MKKKFLRALALTATVTSVASVASIQKPLKAYADEVTTSTQEEEDKYEYKQSLSDLQSKITNKMDKMTFTNSTSESEVRRKAKECIRDDDEYSIDIEDFEREKATRKEAGSITFNIIIEDYDGVETTMNISKTIDMLGTNVYRKLPELNKYAKVTDQGVIDDVLNGKSYDKTKYYVSDEAIANADIVETGWTTLEDGIYYISESDGVKKGWAEIDGQQYHFDETTGKAKTKWELYNGKWYFMGNDGAVLTGFKTIDDVTYYLTPAVSSTNDVIYTTDMSNVLPTIGSMAVGWKQISGQWYFFNSNGAMQRGWKEINGKWYYFNETGAMLSNTEVDGYTLDENGVWIQ